MWKLPRPVLNKQDFYHRFHRGEFGNHTAMWQTIEEYEHSSFSGLIAIRTKIPGHRCDYNISPEEVRARYNSFLKMYPRDKLQFSAMAPTEYSRFQGEVTRTTKGIYVLGSTAALPMRQALKSAFQAFGLTARAWLQWSCDPASYEWIDYLLDAYPDHAVEFSSYNINCGVIPHRNTVIWEVRKY